MHQENFLSFGPILKKHSILENFKDIQSKQSIMNFIHPSPSFNKHQYSTILVSLTTSPTPVNFDNQIINYSFILIWSFEFIFHLVKNPVRSYHTLFHKTPNTVDDSIRNYTQKPPTIYRALSVPDTVLMLYESTGSFYSR